MRRLSPSFQLSAASPCTESGGVRLRLGVDGAISLKHPDTAQSVMLLCARRERPRNRRAAQRCNELASSHVLPSSRGSHPTISLETPCCASQHFGPPDFRIGVNGTHYRAAALLSASPQLAESFRAAKGFRVVPQAVVSRCNKDQRCVSLTRSRHRRARAACPASQAQLPSQP